MSLLVSLILRPSIYYILGTFFFLVPGMITEKNILWIRTDENVKNAIVGIFISISSFTLGDMLIKTPLVNKRFIYKNLENDRKKYNIKLKHYIYILSFSIISKLFFDGDNLLSEYFYIGDKFINTSFGKYFIILKYLSTGLSLLAINLYYIDYMDLRKKLIILILIISGIFNFSRTPAFYTLGTIIISYLLRKIYKKDLIKKLIVVILIPFIIYLAVYIASLYKASNILSYKEYDVSINHVLEEANERKYDLAVSDTFGNLLFILDNYPSIYDYKFLLTPLVLLTSFIPREWIQSWKPYSSSYYITEGILGKSTFEDTGTSLAPSIIGEFYMNGGYFFVALYSFLFGMFFSYISQKYLFRFAYKTGSIEPVIPLFILVFLFPRGDSLTILVRGTSFIFIYLFSINMLIKKYGYNCKKI